MSWMRKGYACLLVGLTLSVSAAGSGPLRIEQIDNHDAAASKKAVVDYTAGTLRGSTAPPGTAAADNFVVEAAWRPAGEDVWTIAEARGTPYRSGSIWNWVLSAVHVGERDDYDVDMELIVLMANRDRALPAGRFGTPALLESAIRVSEILTVRRAAHATDATISTPDIRLRRIGQELVRNGPEYDVNLHETVEIELRAPERAYPYVIVTPRGANGDRWIMPYGDPGHGNLFYSEAFYGREGLDQWVEFLTYGALFKHALKAGRIGAEAWDALAKNELIALSPVIRVRRVEPVFDERTQIRLVITRVQNRDVNEHVECPVPSLSVIEGRIEGRPVAVGEEISVFDRPNGEGSIWKYLGRAILISAHAWQLPPVDLGPPGRRLAIFATASAGRPAAPSATNIFAESQRYHVVVAADIVVRIVGVGGRAVVEGEAVKAGRLATAEVEMNAPALTGAEKVWIYARDTGVRGSWRLLRRVGQKEGRVFHMFPSILADTESSIWLIAIVSDAAPPNLDDSELQSVVAFSKPVRVNIE